MEECPALPCVVFMDKLKLTWQYFLNLSPVNSNAVYRRLAERANALTVNPLYKANRPLERGEHMDERETVNTLDFLNQMESELAEREKHLVSEDGKALAAMLRESLQIAKRQASGQFE